MRIVGGTHGGRTIVAPKGHSARPTTQRARQAIFDVLEHAPWSLGVRGRRVADLFAGSGALGIEALSRGASSCLFVDRDPASRATITENLRRLGMEGRARVVHARLPGLPSPSALAELFFLDPPYASDLAALTLESLAEEHWAAAGSLAVVEREASACELSAAGWRVLDCRCWSSARVDFLEIAA